MGMRGGGEWRSCHSWRAQRDHEQDSDDDDDDDDYDGEHRKQRPICEDPSGVRHPIL